MQFGTRAALEGMQRKHIDVPITELDMQFRIREMSGTERDTFEVATFKEGADGKRTLDTKYLRARLVALCLVGEDGKRLYADKEVQLLSDAVGASAIDTLFKAAQKLNGLEGDAVDAAAKNSASVPADASSSASS